MSKKSQLDRAIESLEEKKADLLLKFNLEIQALDHAILSLKAQAVKKRINRPQAVAAAGKVGA